MSCVRAARRIILHGPVLLLLVLLFEIPLVRSASGSAWLAAGSRQRAMGGAGVACPDDSSAIFWNPAALALAPSWGTRIEVGTGLEVGPDMFTELASLVEDIIQLEQDFADSLYQIQDRLNTGSATLDDLVAMLRLTLVEFVDVQRHDLGALVGLGGGVQGHVKRFGFAVNASGHMDMGLVADLQNLALAQTGDAAQNMAYALQGFDLTLMNPNDLLTDPASPEYQFALHLADDILVAEGGLPQDDARKMAEVLVYYAVTPEGGGGAGADFSDPKVQDMMDFLCHATVGSSSTIIENDMGLSLRGAAVQEYALATAFPLLGKKLLIGGSVKLMTGTTCEGRVSYSGYGDISGPDEVLGQLVEDIESNGFVDSTRLSYDLGLLFRPSRKFSFGLVGKNLNGPEFDLPVSADKFKLKPEIRAGIAVTPNRAITVALDVDITENTSQLAGDFGTRFYALGAEFSILRVLQLRVGMYGNLLTPGSPPAITAGLGVKAGPAFSLDIAANLTGDPSGIQNLVSGGGFSPEDIPTGAGVSLSLQIHTKF